MASSRSSVLDPNSRKKRQRLHLREIKADSDMVNETVGADLRAARLRLGYDLGSVANALRINIENLKAIEESDLEALPGVTYALGFVRSYADFVGLGADECIRRFKTEITQKSEVKFSAMTRGDEKGFPFATLLIVTIVIALAGVGWYVASLALSQERDVVGAYSPDLPRAETGVDELTVNDPNGVDETLPYDVAPVIDDQAFAPSQAVEEDIPDGTSWGSENHDGRIRLRARTDVWIRVEAANKVLFERTLLRGDSYTAPNLDEVLLATRDAGALDLFVDDNYLGRIGLPGAMSAGLALRVNDLAVNDDQP
jgi:cytoskeleton protein RodZ